MLFVLMHFFFLANAEISVIGPTLPKSENLPIVCKVLFTSPPPFEPESKLLGHGMCSAVLREAAKLILNRHCAWQVNWSIQNDEETSVECGEEKRTQIGTRSLLLAAKNEDGGMGGEYGRTYKDIYSKPMPDTEYKKPVLDLAALRVEPPFPSKITDSLKKMRLPKSKEDVGRVIKNGECRAAGYGYSNSPTGGLTLGTLVTAKTKLYGPFNQTFFAAKGEEDSNRKMKSGTPSLGDSGGPIYCKDPDRTPGSDGEWVLMGLVSRGDANPNVTENPIGASIINLGKKEIREKVYEHLLKAVEKVPVYKPGGSGQAKKETSPENSAQPAR